MAAAAAAAAAAAGALAAASGGIAAAACGVGLMAYTWDPGLGRDVVVERPELATRAPLRACAVGDNIAWHAPHFAALAHYGAVRCFGSNRDGQLGTGDREDRGGLTATTPPTSGATAVACTFRTTAALGADGAVITWGAEGALGALGRCGDGRRPAAVAGLPPVALLGAGPDYLIAVSRGGEAHGWGANEHGQLALGFATYRVNAPQPIPALSGRGLRRLACGALSAAAEGPGEILWWGWDTETVQLEPRALQRAAGMRFPLRGLGHYHHRVVAADSAGAVWVGAIHWVEPPLRLELGGERAVRVAAGRISCLVLTDEGRLWDVSPGCRSIHFRVPQLSLGLVPHGSACCDMQVLLPDHCGGKARLRQFARVAVRLGLPSDPLRAQLTHFVVNSICIPGPPHDPFGSSLDAAPDL